ncbi:exonuclease domain-containing protein [Vibrio cholerae]
MNKNQDESYFHKRVKRVISGIKYIIAQEGVTKEQLQVLRKAIMVCEERVTAPNNKCGESGSTKRKIATSSVRCSGISDMNTPVVLDTETTGFSKNDQVIDIAIVDLFGNVLFSSKIKPTVAINPMARRVHRIRDNELKDAPSWADISQEVMRLLKDRKIIIFNAAFDSRMIKQTADAFNEKVEWWNRENTICAMELSAQAFPHLNKKFSLEAAIQAAGIVRKGKAHSAISDAIATAELFRAISREPVGCDLSIDRDAAKHMKSILQEGAC